MPQELVTRNHLTDSSRKSPMGLAKRQLIRELAVESAHGEFGVPAQRDECDGCRGHAVQFPVLERFRRATWTMYAKSPLQPHRLRFRGLLLTGSSVRERPVIHTSPGDGCLSVDAINVRQHLLGA